MKILMTSSEPIARNGVTSVILNIISSVHDNTVIFDIVCKNTPEIGYSSYIEQMGSRIFVIPRSSSHPIRYIKSLTALLKENKYDIVHAHGNSSSLLMEMIACILAGVRIRICHSHSTSCSNVFLHRLLRPIFCRTYTLALACGKDAGKWLYGKKKFLVINNSILVDKYAFDITKRSEIRKKYGINNEIVLGNVGTFNDLKNQIWLIDLLHYLQPFIDVKLILIGDGKNRELIEKRIADFSLSDKVILTGGINNVADYLSSIDVFVLPSLREGLPLSLIEAQVNGLVCFVSDTVTREVNVTNCIFYYSLNQQNKWIHAICEYADYYSIDERNRVSKRNTKMITDAGFNLKEEAKRIKELYMSLLK